MINIFKEVRIFWLINLSDICICLFKFEWVTKIEICPFTPIFTHIEFMINCTLIIINYFNISIIICTINPFTFISKYTECSITSIIIISLNIWCILSNSNKSCPFCNILKFISFSKSINTVFKYTTIFLFIWFEYSLCHFSFFNLNWFIILFLFIWWECSEFRYECID